MTGTSASFVYDPLHRQAQKTVGSTETRYLYAGWVRLADYDGVAGTLQSRYVYGTGMDEPIIIVSSGGTVSYLHADRAGSVIAQTNSSGAVTNQATYSPFGETADTPGTTFGFTGQRYDAETGLYYYKLRYYSPTLGRFLQTDPIGAGRNSYAYVGNDPLNNSDPLGLIPAGSLVKGGVNQDNMYDPSLTNWNNNDLSGSGLYNIPPNGFPPPCIDLDAIAQKPDPPGGPPDNSGSGGVGGGGGGAVGGLTPIIQNQLLLLSKAQENDQGDPKDPTIPKHREQGGYFATKTGHWFDGIPISSYSFALGPGSPTRPGAATVLMSHNLPVPQAIGLNSGFDIANDIERIAKGYADQIWTINSTGNIFNYNPNLNPGKGVLTYWLANENYSTAHVSKGEATVGGGPTLTNF